MLYYIIILYYIILYYIILYYGSHITITSYHPGNISTYIYTLVYILQYHQGQKTFGKHHRRNHSFCRHEARSQPCHWIWLLGKQRNCRPFGCPSKTCRNVPWVVFVLKIEMWNVEVMILIWFCNMIDCDNLYSYLHRSYCILVTIYDIKYDIEKISILFFQEISNRTHWTDP